MTTPVFTYNNTAISSVGVGANIVKVIGIILGINGPVGSIFFLFDLFTLLLIHLPGLIVNDLVHLF